VPPDPLVRRVRPHEIDIMWPACVAMFTEEVGVSPIAGDGGASYRARLEQLIRGGRAFARIENGRVIFKAEIGAVTPQACQVQGVWVRPDRRGQGLAAPGMAAVVVEALRSIAPLVSLYVNDFNSPARAAYRRVGFTEAGHLMSVLFLTLRAGALVAVADFAEVIDHGAERLPDLLELAWRQPVDEMAADVLHVIRRDPLDRVHAVGGQHGERAALVALAFVPPDEPAALHPGDLVRQPAP
jgi:GNAT superfamily N-acetyltransferase